MKFANARAWSGLIGTALILAGCTSAPPATPMATPAATSSAPRAATAAPAANAPAATPVVVDGDPVDGWTGALVNDCAMALFPYYFRRDDGLGFGLQGATAELQAQIEHLRCQEQVTLRVWGKVQTGTMDAFARGILVERIAVESAVPAPAPETGTGDEPVSAWQGHVRPLCASEGGPSQLFEREGGMRYGIAGAGDAANEELMHAACEGYAIRISGVLHKGVDDYRKTRIVVDKVERVP